MVKIDQVRQLITLKVNEKLSENLTKGVNVRAEYQILPEKRIMTLIRFD